jgi:hypothetical protein
MLAGAVAFATPAAAQRLFGTVVLADGRTPAVGAIVTALDARGRLAGRELAASRGDFVIPLPAAGRYALVAERVGSLGDTTRDLDVGEASDVRARVTLARSAPRPTPVLRRSREVCDLRGDTTGLAGLWAQFQVALTTTAMAEESRAFVATWVQRERTLDANLRDTIGRSETSVTVGLDVPVFPLLPPDSSSRVGFVLESDRGVLYHAVGTATLRAPSFLNRRCFALEPAPAEQPGWLGLHFRTTSYRIGVSEVEGTVWFDAASLEPRALTWMYGGLPPSFAPARSGGGVRYLRLPTGHWVVDEWTLRIPSGRYRRMFAYDVAGAPTGYGNLGLDGVRITTARLAELVLNGTTIVRNP